MIELHAKLNYKEMRRLKALTGKARYAGAKALTFTAKDAQKSLQVEAATKFHLRNSWVLRGIRIDAATPGRMKARVGSVDKYMERHVTGKPKAAAKTLSVRKRRDSNGRLSTGGLLIKPYHSIASAPTHTKVRSSLKRIGGQKRKPFEIIGRGGTVLIVRRTSKKRKPLEVLATLKNGANSKPVWNMQRTVQTVVSARFGTHFSAALLAQR